MEKDPLKIKNSDIEAYLLQYNIGTLVEFNFIRMGLNYSYMMVTTKGNYVFRIYRNQWRSKEDIHYELDAILHILKYSSNVSFPIADLNGVLINEIICDNKNYYGVMFSYAEGEIPQINEESSFALGKNIAELHLFSENFHSDSKRSYNIDLNHLIDEPMSYLSEFIEQFLSKESCVFISELASYIKNELSRCNLKLGFCHGELHDWNVHYDTKSYTIFDFDCCGYGFRAYDIAVFWWNLKINYPEKETCCWKAFLDGYQSIEKISTIDLESLPLFVTARRYWLAGILLKNPEVFGTSWINEKGLTMLLGQLKDDAKEFNYEMNI